MNSVLDEEDLQPVRLWWLSFSDDARTLLGVVIVPARGMISATHIATALGINPGGTVAGWPLPDDREPPRDYWLRLIARSELEEAGMA